jgi:hypothetical protein
MTTSKIQAGTISHGTLRTEDLIKAFVAELESHTIYTDAPLLKDAAAYLERLNACGESEEIGCEILDALFDALNDIAPEGMHFGALEGDGSDFGFWYTHQYECERPGGCGAMRRTTEFDHYEGCNGRDPANCAACALTYERQRAPNYSAWPLAYMMNGRDIPAKWRDAFHRELASDNAAYVANVRAHMAKFGVRFTDGAGL